MLSKTQMVAKLKALPKTRGKVIINSQQTTAKIVCQWHYVQGTEREKTPSFIVNLQRNGKFAAGTGRCFGCGRFVRQFEAIIDPSKENLADSLKDDDEDDFVQPLYNDTVDAVLHDEDPDELSIPNALPWNRNDDWRSIRGQLMYLIDAKMIFEEEFETIMAYLPCMVEGNHVGGIKARLEKKGKFNYVNTPGDWVKELGLFPYDFTVKFMEKYKLSTVVLVEGPRDALRCLQMGIPAMAILGSQNWSENKAELVTNLNPKRVITAMDGDKAGRRATLKVYESLKGEAPIYNFRFDKYDTNDPGEAPVAVMKKLKSFCI